MTIERELQTFCNELASLLATAQGKFALVHGDTIVSVFETFRAAEKTGYDTFGPAPFIVKQIVPAAGIQYFEVTQD